MGEDVLKRLEDGWGRAKKQVYVSAFLRTQDNERSREV
jgi:hypothetical protein